MAVTIADIQNPQTPTLIGNFSETVLQKWASRDAFYCSPRIRAAAMSHSSPYQYGHGSLEDGPPLEFEELVEYLSSAVDFLFTT
ncbi:hypothetical protein [Pseudomonas chlororaphis]|uniref:hypothetical protein n=1 Tax=Pseudomonas chlororaphis TaxID=587753 RepID=UPI0023654A98|nr:hypothetical protein [Pseudomonas chlororaphis]WDH22137.1 hypothetical protein PUP50_29910 [Pseudomonas chlororaphis]